ncbi:MAG: hypothetical protein ACK5OC_26720 [Pirellula sp.]
MNRHGNGRGGTTIQQASAWVALPWRETKVTGTVFAILTTFLLFVSGLFG